MAKVSYTKYNNSKQTEDGHKFDSVAELEFYRELKERQQRGEISSFELQPVFELQPSFKKNGITHRAIKYIADFKIMYPDDSIEIVDVKGAETDVFKMKHKLFEYKFPDLSLLLLKKVRGIFIPMDQHKKELREKRKKKNGK